MTSAALDRTSPGPVVVAMSGGVNSSVVAALLKSRGHDVIGITLQLYDIGAAKAKSGSCCAGTDIADARKVAERLDIPYYVLDYEARFRKDVIDGFADSYLAGETPIPCIQCNDKVKFRDLLTTARDLGASALATGHYVRRIDGDDGPELHRAHDLSRDQSYFLYRMRKEDLDFLRFPLGDLPKSETRALAQQFGLAVAEKPDSQDICFVPQGRYSALIDKLRPGAAEPGDIVDLAGNILGRHEGVIHFTIGQRKGLGIAIGDPLFVVKLDAAKRQVVVGPKPALFKSKVRLRDVNWLDANSCPEKFRAEVKLRAGHSPAAAMIVSQGNEVLLDDPQSGIAPGQACVFYDGTRLLGGGWIVSAE